MLLVLARACPITCFRLFAAGVLPARSLQPLQLTSSTKDFYDLSGDKNASRRVSHRSPLCRRFNRERPSNKACLHKLTFLRTFAMQIPDPRNNSQVNSTPSEKLVNKSATSTPRATRVDTGATQTSTAQSSELKALVLQLQESPTVRLDVVAAAKVKLADGTYTTRNAAEKTASAILGGKATE